MRFFMASNILNNKFSGATRYVLDDELASIVNITMALEMPLLLKGEPGTGKTMLAHRRAWYRQNHAGPCHCRESGHASDCT